MQKLNRNIIAQFKTNGLKNSKGLPLIKRLLSFKEINNY